MSMKKETDPIDATPSKKTFLPIIADYDLNKSICELIDNVLDIWLKDGRKNPIEIDIDLDTNQQTIRVADNAGGVKKSELHFIVGPGQTGNVQTEETIGIFGVGSKRAVVALSQDIKITTRHKKEKTYLVELNDAWLKTDEWELPAYEVDNILEGTTVIELQKLRFMINDKIVSDLKDHI
jgi:hypothetical protein